MAEICSKCRSVACASSRATVVLPVPGGPQNTRLPSERVDSMRVSAPSGPSRWSCPTTSSSFCGRRRSASGRGASLSRPAAANRVGPAALARGVMMTPRAPARSSARADVSRTPRMMPPAAATWIDLIRRQVRRALDMRQVRSATIARRRLLDALVVHRHDDVAAPEADIAGIGAGVDVEDDDAAVDIAELQLVGQRRREIGDLGAEERRARADGDLVARRPRARCAAPPWPFMRAAVAQQAELGACRRAAWWRSGS